MGSARELEPVLEPVSARELVERVSGEFLLQTSVQRNKIKNKKKKN
jgi:hypothetical protein